jgi:hypothetical protein
MKNETERTRKWIKHNMMRPVYEQEPVTYKIITMLKENNQEIVVFTDSTSEEVKRIDRERYKILDSIGLIG